MADPAADTLENRAAACVVAYRVLGVANQAPDLILLANQFLRSEERVLTAVTEAAAGGVDVSIAANAGIEVNAAPAKVSLG